MAILYPGNRTRRDEATSENNRFADLFLALADAGLQAEPAVNNDDFCDEVREQLLQIDAVLVWVNPIDGDRDRTVLDGMLREVAATGVFVSTHPDVILKMGTKEVLYTTREIGWGCDTALYRSLDQMRRELPKRLETGEARILKQYRGNGGLGVWEVQRAGTGDKAGMRVRARHAKRGSVEAEMSLEGFIDLCATYFAGDGRMVDQAYQTRLPEGMVRCYLVHGQVVGFGLQAINALYPAPDGAKPEEAPQPGPRLYDPPDLIAFQALKATVERDWVPAMQQVLDIDDALLPVLLDCDFLLGSKTAVGEDTYVLCEINVSSVAPYPESAVPFIAEAVVTRIGTP